jgi:Trk K+ transport system NAD-binding subunit
MSGTDYNDGCNRSTILTVKSARSDVDIIALSDDSDMRSILTDAGADTVLSPHGLLGRRFAKKAVSAFRRELDTVELGGDLEVTELPVRHDSPLAGTRIRNSRIREATGADILPGRLSRAPVSSSSPAVASSR